MLNEVNQLKCFIQSFKIHQRTWLFRQCALCCSTACVLLHQQNVKRFMYADCHSYDIISCFRIKGHVSRTENSIWTCAGNGRKLLMVSIVCVSQYAFCPFGLCASVCFIAIVSLVFVGLYRRNEATTAGKY